MKILILGGNGLVGHKILQICRNHLPVEKFKIEATFREEKKSYKYLNYKINISNSFFNINVNNFESLSKVINIYQPNLIINCIGLTKKISNSSPPIHSIYLNSYFPHLLSNICLLNNIKLIHLSTDCIFSGKKGNYLESDSSDATDIYGKTKYLGEIDNANTLTLRSSILGPELVKVIGIYSWFIKSRGSVIGFDKAFFSGFTSVEIANIIIFIIKNNINLSGVYHLSSYKISKFDLLCKIKEINNLKIEIIKSDKEIYDRTLISEKFKKQTGYVTPSWEFMLKDHNLNI